MSKNNSNSINKWKDYIESGLRYREKYGSSKRWGTYRDYGRGIFSGFSGGTNGILPYNLTYEMRAALVPSIYFRNPYITISPRFKPGFHIHAKVVEAVDNWLLQELAVKGEIKTAISDCYFTNRGILKLGYDSLYGTPKSNFLSGVMDTMNTPISQLGKKGKERIEYNVNVKTGMPWAVRVIPDKIIVPFGVKTLEDCEWIDHVVMRKLEDVKADPKYTNTAGLEGTHMEMLNKHTTYSDFYKELVKNADYVEMHEIHDLKRGEIKVFVPGYEKWIREPQEDVMQIEGLPFVDFTFNEDTEFYWGASDAQLIEPQQLEINEARTQAMLHRRIALVKFLVEGGAMEDDEIDKMMSEGVGPVVKIKSKPSEAVALLQPHIPADLTQWSDVIRSDVRELLGQSRQAMGEAPPGRRTKFEMQVVHGGRETRMDERRDVVADALSHLVRKINQIIFSKWSMEKVVQVVGYDGAKYWVEYNASENSAEYNVKVDVESMTPTTKAMKKQEIMQVMQALSKNPRANIDHLMRMLLREFEWMDVMEILPPAKETMSQSMGEREFVGHQQGLLNNPEALQNRANSNARMIGSAI